MRIKIVRRAYFAWVKFASNAAMMVIVRLSIFAQIITRVRSDVAMMLNAKPMKSVASISAFAHAKRTRCVGWGRSAKMLSVFRDVAKMSIAATMGTV